MFGVIGGGTTIAGLPSAAVPDEVLTSLIGLFVLLVAAKAGEEVARRVRQPAVVGELTGGFLVGPHALALVEPGVSAGVMAELGVVVLLFTVGLEVRVDDLLAVGAMALAVGVLGMILPMAAGVALALATGSEAGTAAVIGLALAATSIGITSRVLAEAGVLDRAFARVILGAAIVDDVLALLAIGLVSGLAQGDISASTLLVAVAALGLLGLGFAISRRARGVRREAFTWPLFADTPLVPAFVVMFGVALLAAQVGLAAIIGAFVVGLIVAETEAREEVEHEMRPLVLIFTPFFFAVTGAGVDLGALADPGLVAFVLALTVLGILTKLVGGIVGARRLGRWGSVTVGIGMAPRGEVGIVVVSLGAALGLLGIRESSAVLVAVVLTTVIAPVLLAYVIPRAVEERRHHDRTASASA